MQAMTRLRASLQMPAVVRSALVAAIAVWGAWYLATWLGRRHPIEGWFFFDLAKIWLWNVYLTLACVSTGHVVVTRLLRSAERTRLETLALSFPTGLVTFVMGMYLGGFLALYGAAFAIVLPSVMIAVGARPAFRAWQAARASGTLPTVNLGGIPLVISVLGLLLVGLLYLGAMSPEAINYDATWLHMVIPQDYAREGRIIAFPGDQVKNVPHLGAMVTTWGFLVPGFDMPALRYMMALHIEFAVFLWTLVGMAAATRWLAQRDARGTWAGFALFPGIFVYDSNIAGASDHFLALFVVPMVLATYHVIRRFDRSTAILAGLIVGGAAMSKMQALYVLVPLVIWALARAGALIFRYYRRDRALPDTPPGPKAIAIGIGLTAGVALLVMLPHLGSNWVFYSNPLYPLFPDVFKGSHPTIADAGLRVRNVIADWNWHPPEALGERLSKAFEMAFYSFSFVPHYSFVNNLPVFGSTFTLLLPVLVVLKNAGRIRVGALICLGALMLWAFSYWVDRNLQTFLPLLVAVTGAIILRTWELGWLARAGLTALLTVQVAWATPLYFSGSDRLNGAISLIRAGMEGRARQHLAGYRSQYIALGKSLPKNAVVMLHNQHVMLGINRPVILDWTGFQTIIDYRLLKTPRDLYDRLREIGVTHVVVPPSGPAATLQDDVIFETFAHRYGQGRQHFGELSVFPMPPTPPPQEAPYLVLTVGMAGYPDGLYRVDALSRCDQFPPNMRRQGAPVRMAAPADLIGDAKVVLLGQGGLDGPTNERLSREFEQVASKGATRIFLRRM